MTPWRAAGLGLVVMAVYGMTGCGSVPSSHTAEIVQDGRVLRTVDLTAVQEEECMTVPGREGTNTVLIAPGEIRMLSADCPDQICVKSGKLEEGGLPIVCLPHRLVIQWAD